VAAQASGDAQLFEHADGGTLFLDEAEELPPPLQAKLLRAVEYGELQRVGSLQPKRVDVAVIAATNRDLLSTAQREQIRRVLREAGGNKAAAARLLGVSRRSLYRWLERLDRQT
jgi:transcriptional regulator with PAS, ATPase and Fis domain